LNIISSFYYLLINYFSKIKIFNPQIFKFQQKKYNEILHLKHLKEYNFIFVKYERQKKRITKSLKKRKKTYLITTFNNSTAFFSIRLCKMFTSD
jgi:hypothetical protein